MEEQILDLSGAIWDALAALDMGKVRELVDERAVFVHMGMTVDREGEIAAYESGHIKPGPVEFKGKEAIHHFAVTEAYAREDGSWRLVAFVFTALVY